MDLIIFVILYQKAHEQLDPEVQNTDQPDGTVFQQSVVSIQ